MQTKQSSKPRKIIFRSRYHYGWMPDVPDQRDFLYSAIRPVLATMPAKVDLRMACSRVEDQAALGSCTANALVGALEFLQKKHAVKFVNMSRLFIYFNERVIEHSVQSDSGAMLRDGIKTLKQQGVCSEKRWPYLPKKFAVKPPAVCYQEAMDYQITSYHRLVTVDQMRTCLAEGYPFVFGFAVYEGFESEDVAKTGKAELPELGERMIGGHAVLAVGYDDQQQRFLIRNSWGTSWGMRGYFTLPYAYLKNRNLSEDFWTIRSGEQM